VGLCRDKTFFGGKLYETASLSPVPWAGRSGIGTLPRVLLIDREGILRADDPAKLAEKVAELVKGSTDTTKK
jgi:hypothetical protein